MNGCVAPGKVVPLINYSIIVEEHNGEIAEWELNNKSSSVRLLGLPMQGGTSIQSCPD